VLVEVGRDLAVGRLDLVQSLDERATPVELRLQPEITRCALPHVEFSCPNADLDLLRVRYQNWLSVRVFGPPIASPNRS
jgi:hypothetical protein